MIFLAFILGMRQHRITITKQTLKEIDGPIGLKAGTDCYFDNKPGTSTRITEKSCVSSPITIKNSNFADIKHTSSWNFASNFFGGAIYVKSNTMATLTSNTFKSTCAYHAGGAVYIESVTTVSMDLNNFSECHSIKGGSVVFTGSGSYNINKNTFSMSTADNGGAIFFELSTKISLIGNTFTSCSSKKAGGAVYYKSLGYINSSNNKYFKSFCASHGGAIYLDTVTNPTIFLGDQFEGCYVQSDFGGALSAKASSTLDIKLWDCNFAKCYIIGKYGGILSFWTVHNVHVKGLICDESKSNSIGGAIYFYDIKNEILLESMRIDNCNTTDTGGVAHVSSCKNLNIKNSTFKNCNSANGGVIYYFTGDYFGISDCDFSFCKSNTDHGGALFLHHIFPDLMILRNNFTECTASGYGSGIYYEYTASTISEIRFNSGNNKFLDCKSNSGTFYIDSYNVNSGLSTNDEYKNCTASSNGGGFFAKVGCVGDFTFTECVFNMCKCLSATSKAGGMGFNLLGYNSLVIRIHGCTFESCDAINGACISVSYVLDSPQLTRLRIKNSGIIHTKFKGLSINTNDYAIFAHVNRIKMSMVEFEDINIGILRAATSCDRINISECKFTNCDSNNFIILSPVLIYFTLLESSFTNCGNCFQIQATDIVNISSLTMNNTIYHSTSFSNITCKEIYIRDFNMDKHQERLVFTINLKMDLVGGNFRDSVSKIELNSNSNNVNVNADSLTFDEAVMFLISPTIDNFVLGNSKATYLFNGYSITMLSSKSQVTNINSCQFYSGISVPMEISGITSTLTNCMITADDTAIKSDTALTLKNNTISSKNGYAIYIATKYVYLDSDTNCIFSPPEKEFYNMAGNVFDVLGNKITTYKNTNKRCIIFYSPSEQFSQSGIFEPTKIFSNSIFFDATQNFRRTIEFSKSFHFLRTTEFSQSPHFSLTKRFGDSMIFSNSKKFLKTDQFSQTELFARSDAFSNSYKLTMSEQFSESKKFDLSKHFSNSNKFHETSEFSQSKRFIKSLIFSESTRFISTDNFIKSNTFSNSHYFLKTDYFSQSKLLSKSNLFLESEKFTKSNMFSKSKVFDASKSFSDSNKFHETSIFSQSKRFFSTQAFSESKKFIATNEFIKSNEFSVSKNFVATNDFTKTNEFIKSNEFSASKNFPKTDGFSKSIEFKMTNKFSTSSQFAMTPKFSKSAKFHNTLGFSISKEFEKTQRFTETNNFEATKRFIDTKSFSLSNMLSESKLFLNTGEFTRTDEFSQLLDINGSYYFSSTPKFSPSEKFSYTSIFLDSTAFTFSSSFSASNDFISSVKFSLSNKFAETIGFSETVEFTNSGIFKSTNEFSNTNKFIQSNIFDTSKEFSNTIHFSESKELTNTDEFSITENFQQTVLFTTSIVFENSKGFIHTVGFSISKIFENSFNFSKSDDFSLVINGSYYFSATPKFTPSNEFTASSDYSFSLGFTVSNKYSSSDKFIKSNYFDETRKFSDTSVFSSTGDFLGSHVFSISSQFYQTLGFTESQLMNLTEYFSSSKIFDQTKILSESNRFDKSALFSNEFCSSLNFDKTEYFSISKKFAHTKHLSESNRFDKTFLFSISNDFHSSLKFDKTENFSRTQDLSQSSLLSAKETKQESIQLSSDINGENSKYDSISHLVFIGDLSSEKHTIEDSPTKFDMIKTIIQSSDINKISYIDIDYTSSIQSDNYHKSIEFVSSSFQTETKLRATTENLLSSNKETTNTRSSVLEYHTSIASSKLETPTKENKYELTSEKIEIKISNAISENHKIVYQSSNDEEEIRAKSREERAKVIASSSHHSSNLDIKQTFMKSAANSKQTQVIKENEVLNSPNNNLTIEYDVINTTYGGDEFFPDKNIAGKQKETHVGMIAGIVVGAICAFAISSIFIYFFVIKKDKPVTESEDLGAEFESESISTTVNTEFETNYLTQEMPGTVWTLVADMQNEEFFDHDVEEAFMELICA